MTVTYISSHADLTQPRFTGNVWRSEAGDVRATVEVSDTPGGRTWLSFSGSGDARSLAAACLEAADAIDSFPGKDADPAAGTETADA